MFGTKNERINAVKELLEYSKYDIKHLKEESQRLEGYIDTLTTHITALEEYLGIELDTKARYVKIKGQK